MRHGSKSQTASLRHGSKRRKKRDAKVVIFSFRMSKALRREAESFAWKSRLPLGEWIRELMAREINARAK